MSASPMRTPCACSAASISLAHDRLAQLTQPVPRSRGMSMSTPRLDQAVLGHVDGLAGRLDRADRRLHRQAVVQLAVVDDVAERVDVRVRVAVELDAHEVAGEAECRAADVGVLEHGHMVHDRLGLSGPALVSSGQPQVTVRPERTSALAARTWSGVM